VKRINDAKLKSPQTKKLRNQFQVHEKVSLEPQQSSFHQRVIGVGEKILGFKTGRMNMGHGTKQNRNRNKTDQGKDKLNMIRGE